MASSFDDNILQEILSRLPAKSLGIFKSVSRRFRDLISDPIFISLQAQRSLDNISGILSISAITDVACLFYTPLINSRETEDNTVSLPRLILKAACNGLILYGLELDEFYILYNPTTKVIINRIPCETSTINGMFGLAFDPVMSSSESRFTVVIIEPGFNSYEFTIFIPGSGWKKSNNKLNYKSENRSDWMLIQSVSPVFFRRTLHWLTKGGDIVAFNVDTQKSWIIPSPAKQRPMIIANFYPTVWFGVSQGCMTMLKVGDKNEINIWNLVDWENIKWELKHKIRIREDSTEIMRPWKIVPLLYDSNICALLRWVERDETTYALVVCRMDGRWYRRDLSFWMDQRRRYFPFISHMLGESQKF